jgi:type IV pilus assembly protein PilZ
MNKDIPENQTPRPGTATYNIRNKNALYASYMPFVKNGGLFIPTNKPHKLGEEVTLLLNVTAEMLNLTITGRVVWITPNGASGKRPVGIGIQFNESDHGATRSSIETVLAGLLKSDQPTATI